MAKNEKILAIDIGATSIKLCEFDYSNGSAVALSRFAHREYEEELSESTRIGVVAGLLRQMLAEGGFEARKALLCMSGQASLTRFGKIPTVGSDKKKIRQLAEFESTQNIPFAIQDVLWDYQLIPNSSTDSIDIMSVVIKSDLVDQYTGAIVQVGCEPLLIDVASAACYNVARACGIGDDGECSVILTIGGRVSNLVFVDGGRFYARTIPIAGYTITQQIAKEFNIGLPEAEELKRRHGFLALGGAYAEPESETAANVSRIIRNVMTRLLGEINRTVNVYSVQQGGRKPSKMYLAGGSSIITYCDVFFKEKLNIDVEFFNAFKCVTLLPTVDKQALGAVAHMFTEAVGTGLRFASQCPIELSLIPPRIRRQQELNRKKPYFLLSLVCAIITVVMIWFGLVKGTEKFMAQNGELDKIVKNDAKKYIDPIEEAMGKANDSTSQVDVIGELLLQQAKWPAILNEIYRIKPDNLWITSITPIIGEVAPFEVKSKVELDSAGSGENDMFGGVDTLEVLGGMDNPMDMGGSSGGASGQNVTIGGIEISGTSVIPNQRGVTFRLGQEFEFPFPLEAASSDEEEGDSEDGESEGDEENKEEVVVAAKPAIGGNEAMSEAMKTAGKTPEEAYLAAFRKSRLFDPDPTLTAITYYSISDEFRNYSNFRMQLKFAMPVEYFMITQKAGESRMGGGLGGLGGALDPGL